MSPLPCQSSISFVVEAYYPAILSLSFYIEDKRYSQRGKIALKLRSRAKRVFAFSGSNQDDDVEADAEKTAGIEGIMNDLLICYYLLVDW